MDTIRLAQLLNPVSNAVINVLLVQYLVQLAPHAMVPTGDKPLQLVTAKPNTISITVQLFVPRAIIRASNARMQVNAPRMVVTQLYPQPKELLMHQANSVSAA